VVQSQNESTQGIVLAHSILQRGYFFGGNI